MFCQKPHPALPLVDALCCAGFRLSEPAQYHGRGYLKENNMAEAGESKENPFSFKTFVKTKQDTTSPKTNKAQGKQKSKDSAVNLRNKNNFKEEAPFPEVDKQGTTIIFHDYFFLLCS